MKSTTGNSCNKCEYKSDSLFCDLDAKSIENIDRFKTNNLYKKGQTIFYQGNKPTGLFCLKKGKVKILKMGADGKEQIVRFAKPGDLLGYRSLISGELYSGSAVALEDAVICTIDKDVFLGLLQNDLGFNWKMMQQLSRELRQAEEYMANLAQKNVRERVAEVLVILKAKYGFEDSTSQYLNTTLSREELASFVGTATETLIRLLSELKSEGVIETKGPKIKILNFNSLVQIANLEN